MSECRRVRTGVLLHLWEFCSSPHRYRNCGYRGTLYNNTPHPRDVQTGEELPSMTEDVLQSHPGGLSEACRDHVQPLRASERLWMLPEQGPWRSCLSPRIVTSLPGHQAPRCCVSPALNAMASHSHMPITPITLYQPRKHTFSFLTEV